MSDPVTTNCNPSSNDLTIQRYGHDKVNGKFNKEKSNKIQQCIKNFYYFVFI